MQEGVLEWLSVRGPGGLQGGRGEGRGPERDGPGNRKRTEGPCETGGEVGMVSISQTHASVVVALAFVLGVLIALTVPAMARDIRAWREEFWPRGGKGKPADQPGQRQPVR